MKKKRDLYILGAGSFARELESWLGMVPPTKRSWALCGQLEEQFGLEAGADMPRRLPIVGDWSDFSFGPNDLVVPGVSNPLLKKKMWDCLHEKVEFLTFVSPYATIGEFNELGAGTVICPGVVITTNVRMGHCVTVNNSTNIGHDVVIGAYSSIMGRSSIAGRCKLDNSVFVGAGVTVIPSIALGAESKIAAGSVVLKDVPARGSAFGNPARLL